MIFSSAIFKFVFGMLSIFIFYRFIDRMLHRKYPAFFVYIIMAIVYKLETYINIDMGLYRVFPQILFFFLTDLAITFILFEGNRGKKFLTALLLQPGIISISSYVFIPLTSYLYGGAGGDGMGVMYYEICSILIFLFSTLIYELIGKVFENIRGRLPIGCCIYLFVLTIFMSQSVIFICDFQQRNAQDNLGKAFLATCYALTGMCLVIFSIYYVDKRMSLPLAYQQNQLMTKHIETLKRQEEAVASLHHDIKNHFICIKNLLEMGHQDEARAYLEEVTETGTRAWQAVQTGNVYVDAVLNEKMALAKEQQTAFEVDIFLPREANQFSYDLCIILSNALDNALEECQKFIGEGRQGEIRIQAYGKQNHLIIDIINTMKEPVHIVNNRINTTKKDFRHHGIGLTNIFAAVKKWKGDIKLSSGQDWFKISIVLPL